MARIKPLSQGPFSFRRFLRMWRKEYGLALEAAASALLLTLLVRHMAPQITFPLFIVAVLIVTHGRGVRAGLLTTLLSGVLAAFFLLPPENSLAVTSAGFYSLAVFTSVSMIGVQTVAALQAENKNLAVAAEQRADADARYTVLSHFSKALLTELSLEAALQAAASTLTPDIADWCLIDLVQQDAMLHNAALAQPPHASAALAQMLRSAYPRAHYGGSCSAQIVQHGRIRSQYMVEEGDLSFLTQDAEEREIFRSLRLTSYMCVPIQAWNQTYGALLLFSTRDGRHYRGTDLDTAMELAARIALRIALTSSSQVASLEPTRKMPSEKERMAESSEAQAEPSAG